MKISTKSTLLALPAAALIFAGCAASEPDRLAQSLDSGERVVVHLSVGAEGDLEATAIDIEDDGDVECEQEGEHEGENEGCNAPAAATDQLEMLVGPIAAGTGADNVSVLGIDVSLSGETSVLSGGTYWFAGSYAGQNQFAGTVVKTSANERLRVMATIDRVEHLTDGTLQITVLERQVHVNGTLLLNRVESLDEASESDIDCEQEGEHEGENVGC